MSVLDEVEFQTMFTNLIDNITQISPDESVYRNRSTKNERRPMLYPAHKSVVLVKKLLRNFSNSRGLILRAFAGHFLKWKDAYCWKNHRRFVRCEK